MQKDTYVEKTSEDLSINNLQQNTNITESLSSSQTKNIIDQYLEKADINKRTVGNLNRQLELTSMSLAYKSSIWSNNKNIENITEQNLEKTTETLLENIDKESLKKDAKTLANLNCPENTTFIYTFSHLIAPSTKANENPSFFIYLYLSTTSKLLPKLEPLDARFFLNWVTHHFQQYFNSIIGCKTYFDLVDQIYFSTKETKKEMIAFQHQTSKIFYRKILPSLITSFLDPNFSIGEGFIKISDFYLKENKITFQNQNKELYQNNLKKLEEDKKMIKIISKSESTDFLSPINYSYTDTLNLYQELVRSDGFAIKPPFLKATDIKIAVFLPTSTLKEKVLYIYNKYNIEHATEFYLSAIKHLMNNTTQTRVDINKFNSFLNTLLENTIEKIKQQKDNKKILSKTNNE